jgi:hypothetical protein
MNMKLNDILLSEKRAGGDNNPKVSAYEQLKQYKDDPNIFISFTAVDKIGVNPNSKFNTPLGVYTYPLSAIWSEFDHEQGKIRVPFAGNQPNIYVVKAVVPPQSVADYDESSMERDVRRAGGITYRDLTDDPAYADDEERLTSWIDRGLEQGKASANSSHPFVIMWNTTRLLAKLYGAKDMVKWNYLLRRLGYTGFLDVGKGFIHPGEPKQCVFLTGTAFKPVDKIRNVDALPMNSRRAERLANYVGELVMDGKPVPERLMRLVLTNSTAYNRVAYYYSVRAALPVPDEIVHRILDENSFELVNNLFFQWSSRKRIPYTPMMVKYLDKHPMVVDQMVKVMTQRGMEYPPEITSEIMKEPYLMARTGLLCAKQGRFAPKEIHETLMALPEGNPDRAQYEDELRAQHMIDHEDD